MTFFAGRELHGASDRFAAYPAREPITPGDLAATLFWRFGLDPSTTLRDLTNRPYRLAEGEPLKGVVCVRRIVISDACFLPPAA